MFQHDEPWKHAVSKQPVTKDCVVYDSIDMNYSD